MTPLDAIGRTRLMPLRHIVPERSARILVAARRGPGHTVVTVAVDSGMKYLSTALYAAT